MSTLPGEGARKKRERSTESVAILTFRIRSGSPNFFISLQPVALSYHSVFHSALKATRREDTLDNAVT